jgi:hypothetical protein
VPVSYGFDVTVIVTFSRSWLSTADRICAAVEVSVAPGSVATSTA